MLQICHDGDQRANNLSLDWVIDICYNVNTLNKQEQEMGMWTTMNQDTMKDVLKAFNDAAYANYGNHSYGAGYLESLVVEMLAYCPKRYQKALIRSMAAVTQKQEREAIAKMNKVAQ